MSIKTDAWKRFLRAACLASCTAFAYQTLAVVRLPARVSHAPCTTRQTPLLHGRVLLAYGTFELSVAFTPDGRIERFGLNAAED